MKKLISLVLMLFASAQLVCAQASAEVRVANENNRVGNTFTEEQKTKLAAYYTEDDKVKPTVEKAEMGAYNKAQRAKFRAIFTDAQWEKRTAYLEKLQAERAAKAAAQ